MGCHLKPNGLYSRLRIGAVLLAAGEGSRMGGVAKPLIRLQGVPLIKRQLVALSGAGVEEVVIVTGHAREAVEAQVQTFPVTLAHNEAFHDGQQSSVRVGLSALSGPFDAVLVVLADQPLIGADDLTELISAFKKRPAGHVVVPRVTVDGEARRGNPIILDATAMLEILSGDAKLGCRHFIERNPALVHVHETSNTRFVTDLDTLDDVRRLAQRTGWKLELPALEATT
jgi:molybdenum cofactor cytidylyltransferase